MRPSGPAACVPLALPVPMDEQTAISNQWLVRRVLAQRDWQWLNPLSMGRVTSFVRTEERYF